ncbi:MAG TPA: CpsD/CapB family tyrosine-protein kinase [Acidobacteriaceae bacterium]|jgi:capsular exopolysaccharide synthesis family protein|nr:CpsD/CapB family tyrosine-protein kinase [Acidobacteriaceae bacterium]
MSHIFDALQRSDAERAEGEGSGAVAATDLLERAERQASSQWKSRAVAGIGGDAGESDSAESELLFGTRGLVADAGESDTDSGDDLPQTAQARAAIPRFQTRKVDLPRHSRLVSLTETDTPAAEAFRLLGVRLIHLRRERPLHKLLITSTVPQEGKSLVAANLACTLAAGSKQRVLLLEGDVRRPSLSHLFGLSATVGLCSCLQGEQSLQESIFQLDGPGIWILPAGSTAASPLDLIQSSQLPHVMRQLTSWFDWIVIDSPPVLPLADTSIWSKLADGILMVARQGTTEKRQLQRGLEALDPDKVVGAVMNSSTASDRHDYYYRKPASDSSAAKSSE